MHHAARRSAVRRAGLDLRAVARRCRPCVHVTSNNVPTRGAFFGVGALVLVVMWIDLHRPYPARAADDARPRASPPRSRFLPTSRRAGGRRPMRSRTGACRTASPAPATAPPSPASSTTRCAARRRRAYLMGEDTPRAVLLGMLRRERGLDADAIAQLADGARFAPAPLTDDGARAARRGRPRRRAAACARAIIRNGSIRISPRVFGDERAEEGAALASPRAARPARQHAQGDARRGGGARSPISTPSRRAGRRSACASRSRPTPRARRSMPSRPSSRA